ncbi:helix-turn-helix domain-containing protein [Motiliproteus sp.]|uniref:helix-turn-helix domain-containing protein n=1 Tax=Motiliproteus sp. TaxID=1898955 RepID=UPI003BAD1891
MKTKATLFGRLVRKYRIDHGVVLKDMADGVGVSTAYASAVELGNKNITDAFIQKLVAFFNLQPHESNELRDAAAVSQPTLKINMQGTADQDRELAVSFARKYHDLSSDRKKKLMELLEG